MKMKKSYSVKCLSAEVDSCFTAGRSYSVVAGFGDECPIFGDIIDGRGFVLISDGGEPCFCLYPSCSFGHWEVNK